MVARPSAHVRAPLCASAEEFAQQGPASMHDFTPLSGLLGGALIGLAAAVLMLLTGRIAGVTGIVGGLLQPDTADRLWRIAFIAGLIAAPLIAALFGAPLPRPAMNASLVVVAIAGLLVGFGTRMGNGCTSGHGVCGFARLSGRSIAATFIFMAAAIATVAIVRHGIGG
ncbi:YeeE/YedE family protein [Bradyrhizobium sp. Ce-3]|uniref:YeeE/YedE family protein n=1 Tax=Bradyrhizobium sp. Ce-3 TaxID=2913970 RepID=UPI0035D047F4